jgi:3-dehydroquinate dehydratase-1
MRDNARLLGLLDLGVPLVVVGMGRLGRLTRIAAPLLGSLFTYASLGAGRETADGQLDAASLERILLELGEKVHA